MPYRTPFLLGLFALALPCLAQHDPTPEHAAALLRFSQADRAVAAYQALLKDNPDDSLLRLGLCRAHLAGGQLPEAARVAEALTKTQLPPEQAALAQALLGEVHRRAGEPELARPCYQAAQTLLEGRTGDLATRAGFLARRGLGVLDWVSAPQRPAVFWLPMDSKLTEPGGLASAFDTILGRLRSATGATPPLPLQVFVFSDPAQWQAVFGEGFNEWGDPEERSCYWILGRTMYTAAGTLSFYVGADELKEPPRSKLLVNGLAAGLAGGRNWGGRVRETAPNLLKQGQLQPLAELLKSDSDNNTLAAIGGSFVQYLVGKEGAAKFKQLWCCYDDEADPFTKVYGRDIAALDAEWRATLQAR
ncbi:MAG: tetratricopeptide repeat protein [Armatimonadetes bacterium]|nr:tetratricopeptide repeat protein [Armatimonadota bacterium]